MVGLHSQLSRPSKVSQKSQELEGRGWFSTGCGVGGNRLLEGIRTGGLFSQTEGLVHLACYSFDSVVGEGLSSDRAREAMVRWSRKPG